MNVFFALLLILLTIGGQELIGKTVTLTADNLSIQIPDEWAVSCNPSAQINNAVLFAADGAHSSVVIRVFPDLKNPHIDRAFVKDLGAGMSKAAGTSIIGDAQPIELPVAHTYCIALKTTLPDSKTIFAHCYPFNANGKLYVMTVQSFDPGREIEYQSMAKTLHFLNETPGNHRN